MPRSIDRDELRLLVDGGAVLAEVLPANEYAEDHLPGAISLPLRRLEREATTVADPTRPIAGHGVDEAVSPLLLATLTPMALEVSLSVQAELEARAGEADRLLRTHVERAQTRAELARRRYLGVDPGNRLVGRRLGG